MEKKIIIGKTEAVFLVLSVLCTKIFLNFPRVMEENAGTAAWILAVYISILTFLAFYIIAKLYKPFEGKDLIDIGEYVGGNIGRIIIGSVILLFSIYIVSVILREFAENIKIIALNVSPISFVMLFLLGGIIYSGYIGIEGLARYNIIAGFISALGFIAVLIGVSSYYDFHNILPIFGNGINAIFGKGALKISIFSELLFLFMIIPFIKTHKNFKEVGYISIGLSALFLILSTLVYSVVFPYPTGTEGFLSVYQLARLINFGRFFQRVESFFAIIWILSAFLYLSFGFFVIIYSFKKMFKLKYERPLIFPFAILIFTLALIPENLDKAVILETKYFRNLSGFITFGMTIILLIIARYVKLRKGKMTK